MGRTNFGGGREKMWLIVEVQIYLLLTIRFGLVKQSETSQWVESWFKGVKLLVSTKIELRSN